MTRSSSRDYSTGFVFGVLVALAAAVVISVIPEVVFVNRGPLTLALVIAALAAPPTVWTVWGVAKWRGTDPSVTFVAAGTGAMTFDGLGIAYFPVLYGHTGEALAGVGATLLFAFASLAAAGYVMTRRRGASVPLA